VAADYDRPLGRTHSPSAADVAIGLALIAATNIMAVGIERLSEQFGFNSEQVVMK
jgi:hypothetical protein